MTTSETPPPQVGALRALLFVLTPVALLLHGHVDPPSWLAPGLARPLAFAGHLLGAVCLGGAALLLPLAPRDGRRLATLGVAAVTGGLVLGLLEHPTTAFVVLLGAGALLTRIWPLVPPSPEGMATDEAPARSAAWAALISWCLAVPLEWGSSPRSAALGAVAALVASLFAARAADRAAPDGPLSSRWPWIAWMSLVAGIVLLGPAPLLAITLLTVPSVALLVLVGMPGHWTADLRSLWQAALVRPARALVVGFLLLCFAGGVVLALPVASASGTSVGFVDALFTATSATCVTGLIVLDTPHDFSMFGQAVILLLFQIGGLGIMTLSATAFALLGLRLSVKHESGVVGSLGEKGWGSFTTAMRRVGAVTLTAEAVGALILAVLFLGTGDAPLEAAWRGLFTAVSAFCNAGFALQTASLVPYQHDLLIVLTVSVLIVIGGLGPAAVWAAPHWFRGRHVPLQVKLVLVTTAGLLAAPTLLILAVEWSNTLADMSLIERLSNAWFQSVTLRTAGFNTIDLTATAPATWLIMIALMFIGGSPGSTAGGIKTTTFAVLLLSVVATLRGRAEAAAFHRRLAHRSVYEATAIATAGLSAGIVVLLGLLLTQQAMSLPVAIFETTSALGTVGLSLGGTAMIDDVGKFIIMGAMFVGRVGPLSLFVFLTRRRADEPSRLPEENVAVG